MIARLLVITALLSFAARADEDAKAVFERATALFALHNFSEAAAAYEKAFQLRPDPAILYNAAQSHRLAGHKTRALDLYQSLLKLYGPKLANRAEVLDHVRHLKIAIDAEQRATTSPPTTPQPRPLDNTPSKPLVISPPAETTPPPAQTTTMISASPADTTPVTQRKWFWPVIGSAIAVVVAGVTVGVVLGTSKTVDPSPTFGTVQGN